MKEKIEKIMQAENLTAIQFAKEIGIGGSTLSHILNDRNKPSLDVMQRILNRFRNINSDWLILDSGTMYRQEKQSQTPTLFDSDVISSSNTVTSIPKMERNPVAISSPIEKSDQIPTEIIAEMPIEPILQTVIAKETPPRSVKKIIIYYTDNTFQEFET